MKKVDVNYPNSINSNIYDLENISCNSLREVQVVVLKEEVGKSCEAPP